MKKNYTKLFLSILIGLGFAFSSFNVNAQIDADYEVWLYNKNYQGYVSGESLKIRWIDETEKNVQIRIFKDDEYVSTAAYGKPSSNGENSYDWKVPKSLNPGTYTIRLEPTYLPSYLEAEETFVVKAGVEEVEKEIKASFYQLESWPEHIAFLWHGEENNKTFRIEKAGLSLWRGDTYLKTVTWNYTKNNITVKYSDLTHLTGGGFKVKVVDCDNSSLYGFSDEFIIPHNHLPRLSESEKINLTNFPNPVEDFTYVLYSLPEDFSSAKIILTNSQGKIMESNSLADYVGQSSFDMGQMPNGIYLIHLWIDGEMHKTKKIIKL